MLDLVWHGNALCGMQGTTTNGNFLLPFKTGAFLAGVPVQPVILQYGKVMLFRSLHGGHAVISV